MGDAKSAPSFVSTAKALLLRRRTSEAINLLRRGLSIDPTNRDGSLLLCKSLVAAKRLAEARAALDRFLERYEDPEGYSLLVRVCLVLENAAAAFDVAEQGTDLFPDDERLAELWVHAKQTIEGEIPLTGELDGEVTDHEGTPASLVAERAAAARLAEQGVIAARRHAALLSPDLVIGEPAEEAEVKDEAQTSRIDSPSRIARALQRFTTADTGAGLFGGLLGDGPPIVRTTPSTVRSAPPTFDVGDVDDDEDDDALERAFEATTQPSRARARRDTERDDPSVAKLRLVRSSTEHTSPGFAPSREDAAAAAAAAGKAATDDGDEAAMAGVISPAAAVAAAAARGVAGLSMSPAQSDDEARKRGKRGRRGAYAAAARRAAALDAASEAAREASRPGAEDALDEVTPSLDEPTPSVPARSVAEALGAASGAARAASADALPSIERHAEAPTPSVLSVDHAEEPTPSVLSATRPRVQPRLVDDVDDELVVSDNARTGRLGALAEPPLDLDDDTSGERAPLFSRLAPSATAARTPNVREEVTASVAGEMPVADRVAAAMDAAMLDAPTPSAASVPTPKVDAPEPLLAAAAREQDDEDDEDLLDAPTPSLAPEGRAVASRLAELLPLDEPEERATPNLKPSGISLQRREAPTPPLASMSLADFELQGAAAARLPGLAARIGPNQLVNEVPLPEPEPAPRKRKGTPRIVHPMPPSRSKTHEVSLPRVDLAAVQAPGVHEVRELSQPVIEALLTPPLERRPTGLAAQPRVEERHAEPEPLVPRLPADLAEDLAALQGVSEGDQDGPRPLEERALDPEPALSSEPSLQLDSDLLRPLDLDDDDEAPAGAGVADAAAPKEPGLDLSEHGEDDEDDDRRDAGVEVAADAAARERLEERRRFPTVDGKLRVLTAEQEAAISAAITRGEARARTNDEGRERGPRVVADLPPVLALPDSAGVRVETASVPILDGSRLRDPLPTAPRRGERVSSPRVRTKRSWARRLWPLWLALTLLSLSAGVVGGLVVRRSNEAARVLDEARALALRGQAWSLRSALYKAKSAANLGGRTAGVVALAAAVHAQLAVDFADSDRAGAASLVDEAKRLGAATQPRAARDLAMAEAYLALAARPLPEAISRLAKGVADHPESTRLRALHARALLRNGELALAARTLTGLPQSDPMVLRTLAELQWRMGQYKAARATLDASVKAGLAVQQADVDLARLSLAAGKLPARRSTIARLGRLASAKLLSRAERGWAQLLLADVASRMSRPATASRALAAAVAVKPSADADYYYHAARLLFARGRYAAASGAIKSARRIAPRTPELIALEASVDLAMDRPSRASALLRSLPKLNDATREVLVRAQLRRGDPAAARRELAKLRKATTLRRVLSARVAIAEGKPYHALRTLVGVEASPEVELVRGLAALRAKELDSASASLQRVLKSGAWGGAASWALARVAIARKQATAALRGLRAAVKANPYRARYRRDLGRLLLRLGRFAAARRAFVALLRTDAQDLGALAGRARASVELGSPQAVSDLEALRKAGHRNKALLLSARHAMRGGNWDRAELLLAQADPRWVEASTTARLWIARIHLAQQRFKLAGEALRALLTKAKARPAARLGLSELALRQRDRVDAIRHAKAGLAALEGGIFPPRLAVALHVQLARAYAQRRRTRGGAIAELIEALAIDKADYQANLLLGRTYARVGKRTRAVPYLRQAQTSARSAKQRAAAKASLARVCKRLGKSAPAACK